MSNAVQMPMYGIDDYLRTEADSDVRHEYIAGVVYAMAGGSERHNRIAGNIYMCLRQQMRGSACGVYFADVKLRNESSQSIYYPDVMAVYDPSDDHPQYKTSPCLVAEVLSPSSAAIDRREKRIAYQATPSLHSYLLADSESRSVEAFQRDLHGAFSPRRLGERDQLLLSCGRRTVVLSLDDIYEDVDGLMA